jgi:8-oxo-dGTP diphosphatase
MSDLQVNIYDSADDDSLLKFAVIGARHDGKWLFCRHKERTTWEIPGGHREPGETIRQTAARELSEETGALEFSLEPLCAYSVTGANRANEAGGEAFGMLFLADVATFTGKLDNEISETALLDELPSELTYPEIQPVLFEKLVGAEPRGGIR